ncbi:uncharacterized protein [Watersipora subatra]|uniref:uncharacterized protein n=1 Tax=Watersipora subatra TaxID=2589382 RepID=UPI00355BDB6A
MGEGTDQSEHKSQSLEDAKHENGKDHTTVEGADEDNSGEMRRRLGNSKKELVESEVEEAKSLKEKDDYRYDIVLWMFGMLFFSVLIALIFGIGAERGWDALSPYHMSNNSKARFLPEPFTPEPGVYKRSDSEASGRWYYWKLKPEDTTAWTRLFVWASYCFHNLSVWLVLYLQHKAKNIPDKDGQYSPKFSNGVDRYNLIMFGLNTFFHLLHLLNTHTTYDGTAADTSIASSQSSVIVALIVMVMIEFRDRGILFGYPTPNQLRRHQNSIWMSPVYVMRKYHGYFIYWAAIYTFWYHPMENTVGHAFGFAHTWFFMLQGSLTFTKFHLNKYWRLILETWVTIHSLIIAAQTGSGVMGKELWPMFVFGFATVIFLTQLYGLTFWRDVPSWSRSIPVALYVVIVVFTYSFVKDTEGRRFTRISEIIRIPGIYYLIVLVAWLVIVAIVKIQKKKDAKTLPSPNDSNKSLNIGKKGVSQLPLWKEVVFLCFFVLTYLVCVFISWIFEYLDLKVNLIVLTMVYSFAFTLIAAIGGSFFLKPLLPMSPYIVPPMNK